MAASVVPVDLAAIRSGRGPTVQGKEPSGNGLGFRSGGQVGYGDEDRKGEHETEPGHIGCM